MSGHPRPDLPGSPVTGPDGGAPGTRLVGAAEVSDAFRRRLAGACVEVSPARDDDVRDWWPLSVQWAVTGALPAAPAAVVVARPSSAGEAAAVLRVCADGRVPVTTAAGRSGVCGGAVPVFGGVVLDLLGLAGITEVDDISLLVDVFPGTWGDDFEATLRADHGLTAGHWPQSMAISTVGGWVACRGAGQYSTRYGKIEDIVTGLEVALADGTVIRTGGRAPRSAAGPDLTSLFVGSEGTLGVITSARLRVHPTPAAERRAGWAFPSFADGLDACRRILRRGATPAVLRLYDPVESARHVPSAPAGSCGLLVLDEGDPVLVDAVMAVVASECAGAPPVDATAVDHWVEHRNEVPSLASLAEAGIVADTVEIAARWAALPSIYRDAVDAVSALDGTIAASAHQSHAYGDGACLYFTFAGRPGDPGESGRGRAVERYYREAWDAVTGATLRAGGALSHHHGVGLNRGRYMPEALGGSFGVLQGIKSALDPAGVLNPGKLGLDSPWGPPPWP